MSRQAKGEATAKGTPEALHAHAQELIGEVDELAESLGETVHEAQAALEAQASARPYAMLGVGAALGFVLGGGLTVRVGRMLVAHGGKAATRLVIKRLTQAI